MVVHVCRKVLEFVGGCSSRKLAVNQQPHLVEQMPSAFTEEATPFQGLCCFAARPAPVNRSSIRNAYMVYLQPGVG